MNNGISLVRLHAEWSSRIRLMLGNDHFLADLLIHSGPLALGSGFLLLLCIVFTFIYRSRKRGWAAVLSLLTGICSGLLMLLWASEWNGWFHKNDLQLIPVGVVCLVLVIMLVILIRTSAAKKAAARASLETQHTEPPKAVKEEADLPASQAKEDSGQPEEAPKKPQDKTASPIVQAASANLAHWGHDPHAAQKIRDLHALLQEGVITEAEYAAKATQLLERL